MRKLVFATVVGLGVALAAGAAEAQVLPLSVEVRGGAAIPMGDFADDAETGYSYGAVAKYRILPLVSIYGGYERATFGAKDFSGPGDLDFIDSGYRVGGQLSLPLAAMTGFSPYVQAGAVFNTLGVKVSSDGASATETSDRATGFEVGAGAAIPLGMVLKVTPEVRYRRYDATVTVPSGELKLEVPSLTLGIGLQFSL